MRCINVLVEINQTLKEIKGVLSNMPTRADLDAALTALVASFTGLSTDLQTLTAAIAALPKPGTEDFTAEIGQVQQAATAVTASQASVDADIAALNPPPPPPGPGTAAKS
jgi:hypothetical protein